jgi:hypothetical protein
MSKKFQIFVSSTFNDLINERQDAIKSVLDLGHIPSGMEAFPAADLEQFTYIKKVIDECDYYVLIVAGRYGSVDEEGTSFTELEHDYAVSAGKTVLVFIHSAPEELPAAHVDTEPSRRNRLVAFREKISKGRLVKFWKARENLRADVVVSLVAAFSQAPAVGWIRGDAAASETLLAQMNDLRLQVDQLRDENRQLKNALTPAVGNLADLDEPFTVRYIRERGNYSDEKGTISITWDEIFRAVGPHVIRPRHPATIGVQLKHYLNETRALSVSKLSFLETDLNTIKVHLEALKLIRAYPANSVGGGVDEFIQLTDYGRARLLEIVAVPSKREVSN